MAVSISIMFAIIKMRLGLFRENTSFVGLKEAETFCFYDKSLSASKNPHVLSIKRSNEGQF